MSTFWELFAGVGLVIGDLLAVLAAVGTLTMLVVAVINVMAKRRMVSVPDIFLHWSGAGLALGTLTAIGLAVAPGYNLERIGIFFRLRYSTIVLLLVASLIMLVLSIILRRSVMPSELGPSSIPPYPTGSIRRTLPALSSRPLVAPASSLPLCPARHSGRDERTERGRRSRRRMTS